MSHDKRLLYDCSKSDIKLSAIAHNSKFSVFHMPGHKPSPVICIIDIHGIAVKALLLTLNTVRGRIDKTSYRTLPLILKRKTPFIFLPPSPTRMMIWVSGKMISGWGI